MRRIDIPNLELYHQRYLAGESLSSIGRELGFSRHVIIAVFKRAGLKTFNRHYRKPAKDGLYECSICKEFLPSDRFYHSVKSANGLFSHCKTCAYWKNIKNTYKVSKDWYQAQLTLQSGGCAICGCDSSSYRNEGKEWLCVDHCHKTGKARGLLCAACNHAIGKLEDNPAWLTAAVDYLKSRA